MKVFFDYQIFKYQAFGGISRYFFELAKELKKIKGCEPEILAPYNDNDYLHKPEAADLIYNLNPVIKRFLANRFVDKRMAINRSITKRNCNSENSILHETYYIDRIEVRSKKVVTIHDMIYELFDSGQPDRKMTIEGKKKAMDEAVAIISVSENTKKDILKFYPEMKEKIHVIHHGVSHIEALAVKPFEHTKPYLLFVGNRGAYKNFGLLLEVFASDNKINEKFDLICFGGGAPSTDESTQIDKFKLTKKVMFLQGNDSVLNSLYRSASAFVYLSKYEGFGMPVLEAMSWGCPVLCSNTSSLPEVAGNAAKMVDPENTKELLSALNELLFNEGERDKMIKAGTQRAAEFTWDRCAHETFKVYQKVLKQ